MKKNPLLAVFVCVSVLLSSVLVNGKEITGNVSVSEDLFVAFEFKGLDQLVYDQALVQFTPDRIPRIIEDNSEKRNQTVVWSALPLESNDTSQTIRSSFYLGGSAILSFTVNKTSLKRVYEVKTEWRKFKVNLTDSFSIDFAQFAARPVAEWEKPNDTTFYYKNKDTGTLDVLFNLVLPSSASAVRADQDTVFFEAPLHAEDVFLGTPFLILVALAVALVIVLLYRKTR